MFSDESRFTVSVGCEKGTVVRKKDEAFHPDCLKRTVKFPASVMVWGCMSSKGVGRLCFIDGIMNAPKYQDVLENELIPSIRELHPDGHVIFQQDGASCHTAQSTKKWFQRQKLTVLPWPANSPDLSPIESLWGIMKKRLRNERPTTIHELKSKISLIWNSITVEECQNLMNSMNKRVNACIKARGDVTQF